MKKFVLILSALIIALGFQVLAVKPIPSFHVPMFNIANFQEKSHPGKWGAKEKRDMNVQSTVASGGPKATAAIWIYRLDFSTILGPFYLEDNDKITVEIDEHEWGTLVFTSDRMDISVWVDKAGEGGTKPGAENLFMPTDKNIGLDDYLNRTENLVAILPRSGNPNQFM